MKNVLSASIIILLFSFTILSIEGCISLLFKKEFKSISFYKSEEYNDANVQRVLLVPFTFETRRDKIVKEVTDAFFIELQKSTKFDTIVPQESLDLFLQQGDIWNRGVVRAEIIIEARKRYKVDAIIFGTITQYKPYEPPILGVKVGMFSTVSGNVMWSSDAIFDSSESSVIQLVKTYYKNKFQKKQTLYDWRIILLSTKRYAQFVAHHIIVTL